MAPPLKLVSHNHLVPEAEGGETAFAKAAAMGASLVRYDFRFHQLVAEDGRWQWDAGTGRRWCELLEPSLRWTKAHGMRTLVNLLPYQPPKEFARVVKGAWRQRRQGAGDIDDRDAALFSAWAAGRGIDLGVPSPKDFTEALVDRLARGQADGDWDVAGFCVLNEPNTRWPGEPNWRRLRVGPGEVYTTADYCADLLSWVKARIRERHQDALGHAITVVNLYSYMGHWWSRPWRDVAASPDLDVLGIDIYWDQLFGIFAWFKPWSMARLSARHGKPWWLVETAGARGRGRVWKDPSCRRIARVSGRCRERGAAVLGFYRLWGLPGSGLLDYSGAYRIFDDPGPAPTPTVDGRGEVYWENVRGI